MMMVRRFGTMAWGLALAVSATLAAAAATAPAATQPGDDTSPAKAQAKPTTGQVDAIAMASEDLRMSFTVSGMVRQVAVKAGDRVKAGDLLIALEDSEGQAMILQHQLKAHSDLAVRSAREQLKLARIEASAIEELFNKKAATPIELDRARARAAVAELEVEHADQQTQEARHLLAQAVARHARFELRAPMDGIIDTLVVHQGEAVDALKPVVRLVNIDTLHIDAAVPTQWTLALKPGDPAWVRFHMLPDGLPIQGKVLHLAQVADSASDTRIVRIQTPNPQGLPAGVGVTVSFHRPTADSQATGPTQSQASADSRTER